MKMSCVQQRVAFGHPMVDNKKPFAKFHIIQYPGIYSAQFKASSKGVVFLQAKLPCRLWAKEFMPHWRCQEWQSLL
jgi:hypothetical protein